MKYKQINRVKGFIGICLWLFLGTFHASAATFTWVGGASSDWSNPLNWNPSTGVPTSADDVVITSVGSAISLSSHVSIRNFTSSNHTIDLSNYNLSINGLTTISTGSVIIGSGGNITIDNSTDPLGTTSFNVTSATFGQSTANAVGIYAKSRDILVKNSSFYGSFQVLKTGTITSQWFGGNTFYAPVDISNSGGGVLFLSTNAVNLYQSTFNFTNSNKSVSYITIANGLNRFVGDATFNNNSGAGQSSTLNLGNYAGSVLFDGNTYFNNTGASAVTSNIAIGALSTITFGGDVYFTNRGTGTTITTNIFNANPVYFGGNINVQSSVITNAVNNYASSGVMFGNNTNNIISQASGKNLVVSGADGNLYFSGGVLNFNNFKESNNSGIQQIKMKGNTKFFGYYSRFYGQSDFDLDLADIRYSAFGDNNTTQNFTLNNYSLNFSTFTGSNILLSNKNTSPAISFYAGHIFNGPTTIAGVSNNTLTTGWMPNANTFFPSTVYNGDVTFICQGNMVVDQNTPSIYNGKVKLNVNSGFLQFGTAYILSPNTLTSDLEFNAGFTSTGVSTIQVYKANVNGSIYSNNVKNATIIAYYLNQETINGQINSITTTGSNIDMRLSKILNSTSFIASGRTISMSNTLIGSANVSINFNSGIQTLTNNTFNGQLSLTSSSQNLTTNTINGALNITIPSNTPPYGVVSWGGGNKFYNKVNFTNNALVSIVMASSSPNYFDDDLIVNNLQYSGSGNEFRISNTGTTKFNGNIYINNYLGFYFIGSSASSLHLLAGDKQIFVSDLGGVGGNLTIYGLSTTGSNIPLNISLPKSWIFNSLSSLNINRECNITSGGVNLNGNIFRNKSSFMRTNYLGNSSQGNTFLNELNLINACIPPSGVYDAGWVFGANNYPDYFGGRLNVMNLNDRAAVKLAYNSIGNKFMDDIYIYNNKAGAFVTFCDYTSTASLLGVNKNIFLAKSNSSDLHLGTFGIANFYKESNETMNWGDAAQGRILITNTYLNGDLNVKAAILGLNDGTYTGVANFDITGIGGTNLTCSRNTIFYNDFTLTANLVNPAASPFLNFGVATNNAKFIFKGNATFIRKGTGWISLANNSITEFYKDLTYISTSNASFSGGVNGSSGILSFVGDQDQNINFSYFNGTNLNPYGYFGIPRLTINKPSGRLITNATIGISGGYLNLNNGNLMCQTGTSPGVYYLNGSTVSGGGSNSFIDGSVAISQGGPFTFHVGRGQNYMPLSVSGASNANSFLSVLPVVSAIPNGVFEGSLKDIVPNQYWNITNWVTSPTTPPTTVSLNWNPTNNLSINKNVMALAFQTGTAGWTALPVVSTGDNSTGAISNTGSFPFSTSSTPKTFNVGLGYNSKVVVNTSDIDQSTFSVAGNVENNLRVAYPTGTDSANVGKACIHPTLNSDVFVTINKSLFNDSTNLKFTVDGNSNIIASSVQKGENGSYIPYDSSLFSIVNGNEIRLKLGDFVPYGYSLLNENLDASFDSLTNRIVYFKYTERYNDGQLDYKIYDEKRYELDSSQLPVFTKKYGDNFYTLNLSRSPLMIPNKFYILEVKNEVGDTYVLKFFYK